MKQLIYFSLLLGTGVFAQVGIGTEEPKTTLDVRATYDNGVTVGANTSTDGITIPRVNTLESPGVVSGQLVYLTQNWNARSMGTYAWNATYSDWYMLENPKGTANVIWSGKLNQDFIINQDMGGISNATKVPGTFVTDMVDDFNMYNNSTGIFTPLEDGIYRIEIAFDYNYYISGEGNFVSMSGANNGGTLGIAPYILYGLYDETADEWIFRNYEYAIANRQIATTAGKSNYTIGYINMDSSHQYSFNFITEVPNDEFSSGKRIRIKATNSGTSGSSDSTYFVLQKVQGL